MLVQLHYFHLWTKFISFNLVYYTHTKEENIFKSVRERKRDTLKTMDMFSFKTKKQMTHRLRILDAV